MTTISGSASALSSLASLYANENASTSSASPNTLTSVQVNKLVGIAEAGTGGATNSISTLLGGQSTTSTPDLNSIIDSIQAQTDAATASTDSPMSTTASAPTEQQKAASLMQSVYQTQQNNLFTLLG
jgi:hypothetical protein